MLRTVAQGAFLGDRAPIGAISAQVMIMVRRANPYGHWEDVWVYCVLVLAVGLGVAALFGWHP
jgi:hypothetical protein